MRKVDIKIIIYCGDKEEVVENNKNNSSNDYARKGYLGEIKKEKISF